MNEDLRKVIKLLNINEVATSLFIVSLIVSLILIEDEKLDRLNLHKIFKNETAIKVSVINRSFLVILSLVFLYVNYTNLNLARNENRTTKYLNLQVNASILSLIAALIVLYVSIKNIGNSDFNVSGTENPDI